MSAGSFYTITYLIELDLKRTGYTEKQARILRLREILNGVLDTFYIPDLDWAILHDGVNNTKFKDLEDSYQYEAAYKSACDYMITDNLKDFKKSDKAFLTVVSPREFLALFA